MQNWRRILMITFEIPVYSYSIEMQNSSHKTTLNFDLRVLSLRISRTFSLTGKDSSCAEWQLNISRKRISDPFISFRINGEKWWSYFWCKKVKRSWAIFKTNSLSILLFWLLLGIISNDSRVNSVTISFFSEYYFSTVVRPCQYIFIFALTFIVEFIQVFKYVRSQMQV